MLLWSRSESILNQLHIVVNKSLEPRAVIRRFLLQRSRGKTWLEEQCVFLIAEMPGMQRARGEKGKEDK